MNEQRRHPDRGIDHLVLAVRDLDAAARTYSALGFTLTPRAEHPWGTANRLVQLDGSFLEVLEVAHPERLVEHGPRSFSFGAYNRDWLERREGFSMLVFEGHDHLAERDQFAASGVLRDLEPFHFERQATLPDGSTRKVAFSLAFAIAETAPEAALFTCHQHAPELFWRPAYQRHANGARRLVEVAMVADDPNATAAMFAAVQGAGAVRAGDDGGLRVATARGEVRVMDRAGLAARYGETPAADTPTGPHFAAFRVAVADLDGIAPMLRAAGATPRPAGLTIPAGGMHGVALAFCQD